MAGVVAEHRDPHTFLVLVIELEESPAIAVGRRQPKHATITEYLHLQETETPHTIGIHDIGIATCSVIHGPPTEELRR